MEKRIYIAVIDFENNKGKIFTDTKLVYANFDDEAKEKVSDYYKQYYPHRMIVDIEVSEPIGTDC